MSALAVRPQRSPAAPNIPLIIEEMSVKPEDEDEQAIRLAALLTAANKRGDQEKADEISSLIRAMGYDK